MAEVTLTASDGHQLGAYRAEPSDGPKGGVVVIQEIFGVNNHIRDICDRLAAAGYVAIAPALFDRTERGFQSGYSADEVAHARSFIADADWDAFVRDTDAARAAISDVGKTGITGFCMGGTVAFMAATRLDGFACASGFYGGKIDAFANETPKCAVQLHYGSEDHGIPMDNVERVRARRGGDCEIFVYEGAGHGFHCDQRASFHPEASKLAWQRTVDLFSVHIG